MYLPRRQLFTYTDIAQVCLNWQSSNNAAASSWGTSLIIFDQQSVQLNCIPADRQVLLLGSYSCYWKIEKNYHRSNFVNTNEQGIDIVLKEVQFSWDISIVERPCNAINTLVRYSRFAVEYLCILHFMLSTSN